MKLGLDSESSFAICVCSESVPSREQAAPSGMSLAEMRAGTLLLALVSGLVQITEAWEGTFSFSRDGSVSCTPFSRHTTFSSVPFRCFSLFGLSDIFTHFSELRTADSIRWIASFCNCSVGFSSVCSMTFRDPDFPSSFSSSDADALPALLDDASEKYSLNPIVQELM